MENKGISRRRFIESTLLAMGAVALSSTPALASNKSKQSYPIKTKKGCFTLWQIPSHYNTIGNSYVIVTDKGHVIIMDGGFDKEAWFLRGFLGCIGNEVEAWFISHPHADHMGALNEILKDPQDLKVKVIYHSRMCEASLNLEPQKDGHEFYALLDQNKVPVVDIQQCGKVITIDGTSIKVLGVNNPEITNNPYNNNSMILRVWDRRKSVVFLGDAGVECGEKVLNSPYRSDLDCDYIQVAHHGQSGCNEKFYKTVKFHACLWSTPLWVWNNDNGHGVNSANLKTFETRRWMDEKGIKEHHVSCLEGLFQLD